MSADPRHVMGSLKQDYFSGSLAVMGTFLTARKWYDFSGGVTRAGRGAAETQRKLRAAVCGELKILRMAQPPCAATKFKTTRLP